MMYQEMLQQIQSQRLVLGMLTGSDISKMSKVENPPRAKDGKVSLNEFTDYYSNISASIEDDEYSKKP